MRRIEGSKRSELRSRYDEIMELLARKEPTLAPGMLKVPATYYTDHGQFLTPVLAIDNCDHSSVDDLKRCVQLAFTCLPTKSFAFASDTDFSGAREAGAEPVERLFINQVLRHGLTFLRGG